MWPGRAADSSLAKYTALQSAHLLWWLHIVQVCEAERQTCTGQGLRAFKICTLPSCCSGPVSQLVQVYPVQEGKSTKGTGVHASSQLMRTALTPPGTSGPASAAPALLTVACYSSDSSNLHPRTIGSVLRVGVYLRPI